MIKHLLSISGAIPNSSRGISIPVGGKNLVVTGPNGSGKTSFLRGIYEKLNLLIRENGIADLPDYKNKLVQVSSQLQAGIYSEGGSDYQGMQGYYEGLKEKVNRLEGGLILELDSWLVLSKGVANRTALISFFESSRSAKIAHADKALGVDSEKERVKNDLPQADVKYGTSLEQHLVNLKNRRSLALSEDNDIVLAKQIEDWFELFEGNLKELMEDESTKLEFNSGTLKFRIAQEGKSSYTFQSLSSGYLAILDIYSDLLMQSEYFSVSPDKLSGIVLIDEIDAHLHVSLQRLILPFFEKSFPGVQFIVSTHSPFVLTSVKDIVIYDLGRNQSTDEDLSLYSYSSVMEGLLATKTTSIVLDETIDALVEEINKSDVDLDRLKSVIAKIRPFEDKLDIKSKAFYLQALNFLMDKE